MPADQTITDRMLERYSVSELPEKTMKEIESRLQTDPKLKKRLDAIHDENRAFHNEFPFDRTVGEIVRRAQSPSPKPSSRTWRKFKMPVFTKKFSTVSAFSFAGIVLVMIPVSLIVFGGLELSNQNELPSGYRDSATLFGNKKREAGDDETDKSDTLALMERSEQKREERFRGNGFTPNEPTPSSTETKPLAPSGGIGINTDQNEAKRFIQSPLKLENGSKWERLLEYHVRLDIETDDFYATRKLLIRTGETYGYIKSSTTDSSDGRLQMETVLYVKSSELNRFLLDIEKSGRIVSESIDTIDHTENNAWQSRRAARESERMKRRKRALTGATHAWNWQEREDSLQGSEDQFDEAEHEKWKIRDKISWAQIDITIREGESAEIHLPDFRATLIHIANLLLQLGNLLIYGLVIAVVGLAGFLFYRKGTKR